MANDMVSDADHYEDLIKALACEFALNHVNISFPLNDPRRAEIVKDIFGKIECLRSGEVELDCPEPRRNILVLGAGATYATYKDLPLARDAIKIIERNLGMDDIVQQALTHTVDELQGVDKADALRYKQELMLIQSGVPIEGEPTFETRLALLSHFHPLSTLQRELAQLYGKDKRYNPSFTYEVIAHLFAKRFIDVIVNFNFDELLDQAISEEMSGRDYHRILSDHDCLQITDLMIDGRLRLPIYIKPHGTVSDKSSLRFTKDAYFRLPGEMQKLLRSLLSGYIGVEDFGDRPLNVNLVTIGFGMASVEFNHILSECLPFRSKIYHINRSDPTYMSDFSRDDGISTQSATQIGRYWKSGEESRYACLYGHKSRAEVPPPLQYFAIARKSDGRKYVRHVPIVDSKANDRSLNTTLIKLWEQIWELFPEKYKPRGLWRHRITTALFMERAFAKENPSAERKPSKKGKPDDKSRPFGEKGYFHHKRLPVAEKPYLLARCYGELAIALARSKGRVEIGDLLAGRFGYYYRHYRNEHGLMSVDEIFRDFDAERDDDGLLRSLTYREYGNSVVYGPETAEEFGERLSKRLLKILLESPEIEDYRDITYEGSANDKPRLRLGDIESKDGRLKKFEEIINSRIADQKAFLQQASSPKTIAGLFARLSMRGSASVRPRYSDDYIDRFRSYSRDRVLHTPIAFSYRFGEAWKASWDWALIVSERGTAIRRELESPTLQTTGAPRTVSGILAYDSRPSQELTSPSGSLRLQIHKMPVHLHTHHMALFLSREHQAAHTLPATEDLTKLSLVDILHRSGWRVNESFYYERVGLASHIHPVHLLANPAENHEFLLRSFFLYLLQSELYEALQQSQSRPPDELVRAAMLMDLSGIRARLLRALAEMSSPSGT